MEGWHPVSWNQGTPPHTIPPHTALKRGHWHCSSAGRSGREIVEKLSGNSNVKKGTYDHTWVEVLLSFALLGRNSYFKADTEKVGQISFQSIRVLAWLFKHTLFLKLGMIRGVSVHSCKSSPICNLRFRVFHQFLVSCRMKKKKSHFKHLLAFFHYCTSFSSVAKLSWTWISDQINDSSSNVV